MHERRPMYRLRIDLLTDDTEWIHRFVSYVNGDAEEPPPHPRALVSAAPALPPGPPVEGVLEDD